MPQSTVISSVAPRPASARIVAAFAGGAGGSGTSAGAKAKAKADAETYGTVKLLADTDGDGIDEIVIADTGSVDGTLEIASQHADALLSFSWCNDFSAARNFVLEHAHGDWVLSIDADYPGAAQKLEEARQRILDAQRSHAGHALQMLDEHVGELAFAGPP